MQNILFAIWDNPRWYNTLIFSAKSFCDKNYRVHIIHHKAEDDGLGKIDFGKKTSFYSFGSKKKIFFLLDYLLFFLFCFKLIFLYKPKFLVIYNRKALFSNIFLKIFFPRLKIIYHNFDFDDPKNIKDIKILLQTKLEFFLAKFCKILVFPNIRRGKKFINLANIKNTKVINFLNCFPKNYYPQHSRSLSKILNINNNILLVSRLGSIGPNHYIKELILSVRFWKKNTFLVIAGVVNSEKYLNELQDIILKYQLKDRVKIITFVNNEMWFEILFRSKIGICFYQQNSLSHQYMAGTSTKFNNYLYANVPFIVHQNRDFVLFNKKYNIYKIVNAKKPQQIAKSVNFLLNNKKIYLKLKKNSHILFNSHMNFQFQFDNFFNTISKL
jgi:glycosyltransferase involved in cell wall biosynthesis